MLDDEVWSALNVLQAYGLSRSDAIRKAILDAAVALRRNQGLHVEVAPLEADEVDRQQMLEIAAPMESFRSPG